MKPYFLSVFNLFSEENFDDYGSVILNTAVMDGVIEAATGMTYAQAMRTLLLEPLGITRVSFTQANMLASSDHASPHERTSDGWVPIPAQNTYYDLVSAAGINAGIHDMAIWMRALLGGMPDKLPPGIIEQVFSPVVDTPRERDRFNWKRHLRRAWYAKGWRVFDYDGHTMVGHSGRVRGYQSQIVLLPDFRTGVVVLQNGWFANHAAFKFMEMYLERRSAP